MAYADRSAPARSLDQAAAHAQGRVRQPARAALDSQISVTAGEPAGIHETGSHDGCTIRDPPLWCAASRPSGPPFSRVMTAATRTGPPRRRARRSYRLLRGVQPGRVGHPDSLKPAVHIQLGEDVADVGPHSVGGDHQILSYLPAALTFHHAQ